MAAHLDLLQLRRHALPEYAVTLADCLAEAQTHHRHRMGAARPRLVAAWQLDPSGRLACSWSIDTGDPRHTPA